VAATGKGFTLTPLTTVEEEYLRARAKVAQAYRQVDGSVEAAAGRLQADVADILRSLLRDRLVPDGPGALAQLRAEAQRCGARVIAAGLAQIENLEVSYGSVLLRVGGPIIQRIDWSASARADVGPRQARPANGGGRNPFAGYGHGRRPPTAVPDWVPLQPDTDQPPSAPLPTGVTLESLYSRVQSVTCDAVDELDAAMLGESEVVHAVLAAATILLRDKIALTRHVYREYELLCAADRQRIWPDDFDARAVELAAALARTAAAAGRVRDASATSARWR
jgi:hypothetical protein